MREKIHESPLIDIRSLDHQKINYKFFRMLKRLIQTVSWFVYIYDCQLKYMLFTLNDLDKLIKVFLNSMSQVQEKIILLP